MIELDNVRLQLTEWPGVRGPLVHVPDPLVAAPALLELLAARLAPRYRVLSVAGRGAAAYQVQAADLLGVLSQFGFEAPVLAGEGLGCVPALLVAAWHPDHLAGLVMVDPRHEPPLGGSIAARSLRECPPDWGALRRAVRCPVLELSSASGSLAQDVEVFLAAQVP